MAVKTKDVVVDYNQLGNPGLTVDANGKNAIRIDNLPNSYNLQNGKLKENGTLVFEDITNSKTLIIENPETIRYIKTHYQKVGKKETYQLVDIYENDFVLNEKTITEYDAKLTATGTNFKDNMDFSSYVPSESTTKGLTINGGNGSDTIKATDYNDVIKGGTGNDSIEGLQGDDTIYGDAGNDFIRGGDGNDVIYGGNEEDDIMGGKGNDTIYGDYGNDSIKGGEGDNELYGAEGNDTIYGGDGNDLISGGDGNDEIYCCDGNDTIHCGEGNDFVVAGGGNNIIYGDAGDDDIRDGYGNDKIYGGSGNDFIYSDNGNDSLYGGDGNDNYIVSRVKGVYIEDESGANDVLTVENYFKDKLNIVFNVSKNFNKSTDTISTVNIFDDTNFDLWADNSKKIDGIKIKDNSIEKIKSYDGYYVTSADIANLAQDVAAWLTNKNYADVNTALAKGSDADVEALIAIFNNCNWQLGS